MAELDVAPEEARTTVARRAWVSLPVSELRTGGRRLDGEMYLLGGYLLRRTIEAETTYSELSDLASCWMPGRLKGITVARDHGSPYLTATQVYDIRPTPRKWLAMPKVKDLKDRLVERDWILMTRSGSVGDVMVTFKPHLDSIISDDLLRVVPHEPTHLGWIYSFLRSGYGTTMLRSSRYGSTVKHLQPQHLHDVPLPEVDDRIKTELDTQVREVFRLRDEAYTKLLSAESDFAEALGGEPAPAETDTFSVTSTTFRGQRRRLDAYHYNPQATAVLEALAAKGRTVEFLGAVTARLFGVARFKHVYAADGIPYLDSEDLFKLSPELTKFIPPGAKKDANRYMVEPGWLLMACSGQLYGLNGTVVLANEWHANKIVSNHVIRIVPNDSIRAGYLAMTLGHQSLGRPLILRSAFGSEVPEIAPEDLATTPVVRVASDVEDKIADAVEEADRLRRSADLAENACVAVVEAELSDVLGPPPRVV